MANLNPYLLQSALDVPSKDANILLPLAPVPDAPALVMMPSVLGDLLWCRCILDRLTGKDISDIQDGMKTDWVGRISCHGIRLDARHRSALSTAEGLTMSDLAKDFATAIHAGLAGRDVHLLGFSFGGVFAFETARALERRGTPVRRVWALNSEVTRMSPLRFRITHPLRETLMFLSRLKAHHVLLRPDARDTIIPGLRFGPVDLRKIPPEKHHIKRGMVQMGKRHMLQSLHETPLTLFRATEDILGWRTPPDHGWQALTRRGVTVVPFNGRQGDLISKPAGVATVTECLGEEIVPQSMAA